MASSTGSLATKLGVKEGCRLAWLSAPPDVALELPPHVTARRQARGEADVVVAFFTKRTKLDQRLPVLGSIVFPSGRLWIAWPKKTSGVLTDLRDSAVRSAVLPLGLVDNKVCAIDETWSAPCFVWRQESRGARSQGRAPDRGLIRSSSRNVKRSRGASTSQLRFC
jgi:hypothetical protein